MIRAPSCDFCWMEKMKIVPRQWEKDIAADIKRICLSLLPLALLDQAVATLTPLDTLKEAFGLPL